MQYSRLFDWRELSYRYCQQRVRPIRESNALRNGEAVKRWHLAPSYIVREAARVNFIIAAIGGQYPRNGGTMLASYKSVYKYPISLRTRDSD